LIHRDIKPENIIQDRHRKYWIVDFGATKILTETALAKTGTQIGSAEYCAFEQSQGKAVPQSDIYSLGLTCMHMLTGVSPFDFRDSMSGDMIWHDYCDVSESCQSLLNKMSSLFLRDRYCSVDEVLVDLEPEVENLSSKRQVAVIVDERVSPDKLEFPSIIVGGRELNSFDIFRRDFYRYPRYTEFCKYALQKAGHPCLPHYEYHPLYWDCYSSLLQIAEMAQKYIDGSENPNKRGSFELHHEYFMYCKYRERTFNSSGVSAFSDDAVSLDFRLHTTFMEQDGNPAPLRMG